MSFGGGYNWRKGIQTPIIAGEDEEGLWLAAAYPLGDLVRDPSRGKHIPIEWMEPLYWTRFALVKTDGNQRLHGGDCCTVDIFTYGYTGYPGYIPDDVGRKITEAWSYHPDTADSSSKRWYEKPLRDFWEARGQRTPPDPPGPIDHYRFTVDEQGMQFRGEQRWTWARHAVTWLEYALRMMLEEKGQPSVWPLGSLEKLEPVDFYEVADYFLHLAGE